MNNKDKLIQQMEDKLFELEEQWNNWQLDLSIPKQIYKLKEDINKLLTNK